MQADTSEVWLDALGREIRVPASPLEKSLSPVCSPCGTVCALPTAEENYQSH